MVSWSSTVSKFLINMRIIEVINPEDTIKIKYRFENLVYEVLPKLIVRL